jgi:hypothetical protein
MNEFKSGVKDAKLDLFEGWVPRNYDFDALVNHLRIWSGSSDEYIAGYLSVIYSEPRF